MDNPTADDKPKKKTWRRLAIIGSLLLGGTILSSLATQNVAAKFSHHPELGPSVAGVYEPFGWAVWQTKPWATGNEDAFRPINMSASLGVSLSLLMGMFIVKAGGKKPKEHKGVHGTAGFQKKEDVLTGPLAGKDQGVYIGAIEDKDGLVHYLRHHGAEHIAAIAPTRSGKGLGLVLPTLLSWLYSAIINDQKGELWELTAGWRASIGHRVLLWAPGSVDGSCNFNFLEEVRLGTAYEESDAQNIAVMIVDPQGAGLKDHWDKTSYRLISGTILHVMYQHQARGSVATLSDVAFALQDPSVPPEKLYEAMVKNKHANGKQQTFVATTGAQQMARDQKERASVHSSAVTAMDIFSNPIVAKNTSRSDFKIHDLMNSDAPVSLYIHVPEVEKDRLRPLARLMITIIIRKLAGVPIKFGDNRQPILPHKHRMLMMLDEFPAMGNLTVLENTLATCAGYGIKAYLIMQDREQLLKAYTAHETILSNCHLKIAYAPNKWETAEWLSKVLDNMTLNLETISQSGKAWGWLGQISRSFSHMGRRLMTPGEIMQMKGAVKDGDRVVSAGELLIMPAGERPIKGRAILYFEDPTFQARAAIRPPIDTGSLTKIGFAT